MHDGSDNEGPIDSVISNRAMNIAVALVLMSVATVVMVASYKLGSGWAEDVGPDSGYFPFYVALIMLVASSATLLQNVLAARAAKGSFVARGELIMVLQVLVPMTIFVVLAIYIGIYISTALFISFFMIWHGRYPLHKTAVVALAVPVVLFFIFEVWFLVPLPKGPLKSWLGY